MQGLEVIVSTCKVCKRRIDSPFVRMEDNTCPICIKKLALAAEEERLRSIKLEEEKIKLEEEKIKLDKIQAEKEKKARELKDESKRKERIQAAKKIISDSSGGVSGAKEVVNTYKAPPLIIGILEFIGWALLGLSFLAGTVSFIQYPGWVGFVLIASGVIQCAFFNGFALIIKELIEIRKNTASD